MRRFSLILLIIGLSLSALLFIAVVGTKAAVDELSLSAPSTCPSEGCAAGQRLNFLIKL